MNNIDLKIHEHYLKVYICSFVICVIADQRYEINYAFSFFYQLKQDKQIVIKILFKRYLPLI